MTLGQGQEMPLTFKSHISSLNQIVQGHRLQGSEEEDFLKGSYRIWVWRPSWSWDPDAANKLSFPLPKEAQYTIWL